jgi:2-(1,2-epoxy-1,2-dihydrophenyl)acetyl-CoA isomerase
MTARLEDRGDRLIVWNRAEKRGALTPEFYAAIREAVAKAADPRVRAVILTGQGEFFCAGGDLTVLV